MVIANKGVSFTYLFFCLRNKHLPEALFTECKHLLGAQASVSCQGCKRKEDINNAPKGWNLGGETDM